MSKTTTAKASSGEATGINRADTFKTIAGRIKLIGKRRSPALRAVYNEAAALLERAAKEA